MAHYFNHYYPAVALCRGMKPVDRFGTYRQRRIKTKGFIGSDNVVVYCFGKADHVQPLLRKTVACGISAVPPQHYQAVQSQLPVSFYGCGNLIAFNIIFLSDCRFKRLFPACPEDGAPSG